MASKIIIELSDTTELPTPQVEAWLDANDDGKLSSSEKIRLKRSGATWAGTHPSNSGQLLVRVVVPLSSRVKTRVVDEADAAKVRFNRAITVTRRPEWIIGELK